MGLIGWIIFGFLAGLLARAVFPGAQHMGFIKTTLLGVGGSFVGGAIASVLFGHPLFHFHTSGFIGAVIGSLLLLVFFGRGRR
ncbi:MAG TPA: GlsB/YeaQ/YmgE family stress response membrane protein [Myxococcaceae bacterium]|jgi:uncharacterized membrane protein YeaQ/YmgE (transglycosylase-associated protein family)